MRHLVAALGNYLYKQKYVSKIATNLNNQQQLLSKIAETKPKSAHAAFISGFKSKLTCFIRTIPDINESLLPLKHDIWQKFIQAITGGQIGSDN